MKRRSFLRNIALTVAAASVTPAFAVDKAFEYVATDPEVKAILDRMGPLETFQKRAIARYIRELKKDGTWDAMEQLYVMFDNENAPELKTWAIDWKNPGKDTTIQDLCEAGVDFEVTTFKETKRIANVKSKNE